MKEEMELLGAVRLREVEKAQQEIVAIARKLEEEGADHDRRRRGRAVCRLERTRLAARRGRRRCSTGSRRRRPPARVPTRRGSRTPARRRGAAMRDSPPPLGRVDSPALEREAFAKGYAQGERAGAKPAADARRSDAAPAGADDRRAGGAARRHDARRPSGELVQLALAIAERVVHREIDARSRTARRRWRASRSTGSARRAIATIRLHPDDYAATTAARDGAAGPATGRRSSPTPTCSRGGCLVRVGLRPHRRRHRRADSRDRRARCSATKRRRARSRAMALAADA